MKRFFDLLSKVIPVIVCVLLLSPVLAQAETWGEGGGTVDDMLESEQGNVDDQRDAEEKDVSGNDVITGNEEAPISEENNQNLFLLSLQMFAALAVVIFLIYALLKFINKRSRSFRNHGMIENIGGVGLGSNRSVQIIRMGNHLYLVGVGENVQMLKEIDDAEEIEKILEDHQQEGLEQPVTKLTEWVRERLGSRPSSSVEGQAFRNLLDRELKEVKESQEKVHHALKEKDK
ncbi:flagellar protein FliO/FliZ [Evansella caseinilytica]|uniref:Flagellar protein FliO/FliZ n=1 Tax=Evansella caseinilytica TaxID=1503961 RepID=A0A1H3M507_9BACI|nr:flagellar biosynthetic protein FliO [Evansella caseinilytica]SDY71666.1 flagellar protein FliO/FliZ [Evansella caseinilytica]